MECISKATIKPPPGALLLPLIFNNLTCEHEEGFSIIPFLKFIPSFMPTLLTSLHEHLLPFFCFNINWLHETTTRGKTIARVYINMLAPQTLWTMVGIPTTRHSRITVLTGKVFDMPLKALGIH
jgi:hypothetical protein